MLIANLTKYYFRKKALNQSILLNSRRFILGILLLLLLFHRESMFCRIKIKTEKVQTLLQCVSK